MSDTLTNLADCPPRPWKNGLGRTRELAIQTAHGGGGSWLWRISVAEVDTAAPFSAFPGVDRIITLLEGAGFTMTLDGTRRHALTTRHAPFAFPGEAHVAVELAGGPTRDFNVMVRRDLAAARLDVWRGPGTFAADATTVFVYCAEGDATSPAGPLQAGSAWRTTTPRSCTFTLAAGGIAFAVCIRPRAG